MVSERCQTDKTDQKSCFACLSHPDSGFVYAVTGAKEFVTLLTQKRSDQSAFDSLRASTIASEWRIDH